jgi:hypothetical protein
MDPILVGFHLLLAVMVEVLMEGLEEEGPLTLVVVVVVAVVTQAVVVVVMIVLGIGQSAAVVVHLRYLQ